VNKKNFDNVTLSYDDRILK